MLFAAGAAHSLVVTDRGEVLAWGDNTDGQLGDGTTQDRLLPVKVAPGGVVAVAAGRNHSLAVTERGEVLAWGCNRDCLLGVGAVQKQLVPKSVVEGGACAAAAGWEHCLALLESGDVLSWGGNAYGQLGNGSMAPQRTPGKVQLPSPARAVGAGWYHSVALLESGEVFMWGFNTPGRTDFRGYPLPTCVLGGGIQAVAAGGLHSLALSNKGVVLSWGGNDHGQLGDGTREQRLAPVAIVDNVTRITAGTYHSIAVTEDDPPRILSWGHSSDGCLEPRAIEFDYDRAHSVAAGGHHNIVITDNGEVFTWGGNASGQLGDGTKADRPAPKSILPIHTVPVVTEKERKEAFMKALPAEVHSEEDPRGDTPAAADVPALADAPHGPPAPAGAAAAAAAAGAPPELLLRMTGRQAAGTWVVNR